MLYGFGFASALADIGLAQSEISTALLSFNVGVEIGQILFVTALLTAYFVSAALGGSPAGSTWKAGVNRVRSFAPVTASYVIGDVASYWMVERVSQFWG